MDLVFTAVAYWGDTKPQYQISNENDFKGYILGGEANFYNINASVTIGLNFGIKFYNSFKNKNIILNTSNNLPATNTSIFNYYFGVIVPLWNQNSLLNKAL